VVLKLFSPIVVENQQLRETEGKRFSRFHHGNFFANIFYGAAEFLSGKKSA
jgi:hypothetical protein